MAVRNTHPLRRPLTAAALALLAPLACAALPAAARADTPDSLVRVFTGTADDRPQPSGRLVQTDNGDFYGLLDESVYKLDREGRETVLYQFGTTAQPDDGRGPTSLIVGKDGNLYGTTESGGLGSEFNEDGGGGVVFRLTPNGEYTILYNFTGYTGFTVKGIVQGPDGALYGTCYRGGPLYNDDLGIEAYGVLFKLDTDGSNFQVLHNFDPTADAAGTNPIGLPTIGSDGTLYATSSGSGQYQDGTVFRIDTDGSLKVLHAFNDTQAAHDGNHPTSTLMLGSNGTLYGLTAAGGANNDGTFYKINTDGSGYSMLYSFGSVPNDVKSPGFDLAAGSDGNFYGVSNSGGLTDANDPYGAGYGGAFEAKPSGEVKLLHLFNSTEAEYPQGPLTQGHDGRFYGTARNDYQSDGSGNAVVYKLRTALPAATGELETVTLSHSTVTGGSENSLITVRLKSPAGPGGVQVYLSSSNYEGLSLPILTYVLEGHTTGLFRATSYVVTKPQTSLISARLGGVTMSAPLTITPSVAIKSLTTNSSTTTPYQGAILTITLAAPAPSTGEVIAVHTSDNNAAAVPGSVTIPAGATTATFTAMPPPTIEATRQYPATVTITATAGGASQNVVLMAFD